MNIYELRKRVESEVIDFNQLNAILHEYAHPRGKIGRWLKTGDLIRVKKGLYVFGSAARREPYNLGQLANLIYGPSVISLEYALSYYGLIPEAVHTVTSITSKRNKLFNTPVGEFSYAYLPPSKFSIGIKLETVMNNTNILIASPEKALCDIITITTKDLYINSTSALLDFLFDDLRLDEECFNELSIDGINQIANIYRNQRLSRFLKYLNLWANNNA